MYSVSMCVCLGVCVGLVIVLVVVLVCMCVLHVVWGVRVRVLLCVYGGGDCVFVCVCGLVIV